MGRRRVEHIASYNTVAAFVEQRRQEPFRPSRINPVGQMIASKKTVHVHNMAETEAYLSGDPVAVASVEIAGARTGLAVPILKENKLIGAFTLGRQEIRDFTEQEIALVAELRKSGSHRHRERAVAQRTDGNRWSNRRLTSEVLDVISRSPGELQAVFRTMLENAVGFVKPIWTLHLYDDGDFAVVAMHNVPACVCAMEARSHSSNAGSDASAGASGSDRTTVHIHRPAD